MHNIVFVAIGGAIGASMRFGINGLVMGWLGKGFPYGTLVVNVIGSFFMGLLFSLLEHGIVSDIAWRSFLSIGLFGAFTTFSTFSLDTLLLLQQGFWQKAVLNIMLNVFVCIAAAWIGMQIVASK
ncbi:fluoride efflux transporter CrcB [Psychrosphaera haliotis]|uniref:Fluoride-specific ion channel FluC n=1 Tax=Psychrosphaera haliotis TaxID=555083 RepID=A0A6N8F6V0_9GAMM|nr:fluoride efflux transporter CrcB [Psychrosphaera haliotis]MUH71119.1 fluoride efflux transporter CrcB [Psychrosphaera haliotis]